MILKKEKVASQYFQIEDIYKEIISRRGSYILKRKFEFETMNFVLKYIFSHSHNHIKPLA